jgi:hypothetical protein
MKINKHTRLVVTVVVLAGLFPSILLAAGTCYRPRTVYCRRSNTGNTEKVTCEISAGGSASGSLGIGKSGTGISGSGNIQVKIVDCSYNDSHGSNMRKAWADAAKGDSGSTAVSPTIACTYTRTYPVACCSGWVAGRTVTQNAANVTESVPNGDKACGGSGSGYSGSGSGSRGSR